MICPNCNHNNPEGSKFCEECGTKLPEPKKRCPSCGFELNGTPKFCPECGFRLAETSVPKATGVSVGDKNVVAGDLNVVGKKEEFNVSGNATIIKHEDDTKKVETCPICGKSYFRINGRLCKSCGRYVCSDCFDDQHHVCDDCRRRDIEEAESKYRQALEDVLADGKIDKDEAIKLNALRDRLGITVTKAKELESNAKAKRTQDILSSIDEISLEKATTLFVNEKESEAFEIAKGLYSHHPGNDKVSRIYYLSGAVSKSKEILEKAKSVEYDVPLKYITQFLYYFLTEDYSMADKIIQKAIMLWPENVVIRSCEVILLRKAIETDFNEKIAGDIREKISLLPEKCEDQIDSFYVQKARRTYINEADSILFTEEAFKDDVVSTGRMVFVFSRAEENKEKYIYQEHASRAYDLFLQSMYTGNEVALFRLAICYALGCGVKQNVDKAIEYLNNAAEKGYPLAFTRLGDCYRWGRGVVADFVKAEEFYKKATELGDSIAPNNLGVLYEDKNNSSEEDKHKAFEYYSISAQRGNPRGQNNLGRLYLNGIGVEKEETEAVKWFKKAAEQGSCYSQKRLAWCYRDGSGVEQDYKEAFRWYSLAAENGDMDAQCSLGCAYYNGEGTEEDKEKAVVWFRKAAEQGNSKAQLSLGESYRDGDGVEQDYSEAINWFKKAAENGNVEAMDSLGDMYTEGEGVEEDSLQASKWFKMAAEKGYAPSQCKYCLLLWDGENGDNQNHREAFEWARKAADQGYEYAFYLMGWLYAELSEKALDDGESIKSEEAASKSFEWYLKYTESDKDNNETYRDVANRVARCYAKGKGVEKNLQQALFWFIEAAKCGDSSILYFDNSDDDWELEMYHIFNKWLQNCSNEQLEKLIESAPKFGFRILKRIGDLKEQGVSVSLDYNIIDFLRRVADDDSTGLSQCELAFAIVNDLFEMEKDYDEVRRLITKGLKLCKDNGLRNNTLGLAWDMFLDVVNNCDSSVEVKKAYSWFYNLVRKDSWPQDYNHDDELILFSFGKMLYWGWVERDSDYSEYYKKWYEDAKDNGEEYLFDCGKKLIQKWTGGNPFDDGDPKNIDTAIGFLGRGLIHDYDLANQVGVLMEHPDYHVFFEKKVKEWISQSVEYNSSNVWRIAEVLKDKNISSAKSFLKEQLSLFNGKNERVLLYCNSCLGVIFYDEKDYDQGFKYLSDAFCVETKIRESFEEENCIDDFKYVIDDFEDTYHLYRYELGLCYFYGRGVAEDNNKAFPLLKEADENGFYYAMYLLGQCYEFGYGTTMNYDEAFNWYLKSAEGVSQGEYHIGCCYEIGLCGREKDIKKAKEWFKKAAEHGNEYAKKKVGSFGFFRRK